MNIIQSLKNYLVETKIELRKVSWPTQRETVRYVIMVIVFSLIVAAILGLFDFFFLELVGKFLLDACERDYRIGAPRRAPAIKQFYFR